MAVAQQHAIAAQRAAQAAFHALRSRAGFLQFGGHQHQTHHGRQRHRPEHTTPARHGNHAAAGQWRQDGRDAEHQHQQRHQPRCVAAGVEVAHHSARNGHAGRSAQPLQQAPGQQRFNAARQRAAHAGHEEKRHAAVQRQLAPDHVGHWPVQQLAKAQRQKKGGQAPLHRTHRGMQRAANVWQGRQVHVDGKGANGRKQAENQREANKVGKKHSPQLSPDWHFCAGVGRCQPGGPGGAFASLSTSPNS